VGFSNTIWNAGAERVELERNPNKQETMSRQIYQNLLYNAAIGGTAVSHAPVARDVACHPNPERYHFATSSRRPCTTWEAIHSCVPCP
jgi:hypothetical protein